MIEILLHYFNTLENVLNNSKFNHCNTFKKIINFHKSREIFTNKYSHIF